MKLVKLNRRHKAFKEYGHQWAFRWNSYDTKTCPRVEGIMQDLHGSQWRWNKNESRIWQANFGHVTRGNSYRPYWISFTDEADATVVLLQVQN
jgi:hypothetical protein